MNTAQSLQISEAEASIFEGIDEVYLADSCEPLEQATARGEVRLHALARGHYPGRELAEQAVPGVLTVGSWEATRDQSWGLPWHRNEGIEITLVDRGSIVFSADAQKWNLQAGQVVVTRPWQRHKLGDPDVASSSVHWLIVDVGIRRPNQSWRWPSWIALSPSDLDRLSILLQHNEHPVLPDAPGLRAAIVAATTIARSEVSELDSALRIATSRVLLEILRALEPENRILDEALVAPSRGMKMFLADLPTMTNRPWTVPLMARSCSMSTTQFTAICKELTNTTPLQYLNTLRLEQAKKLLSHTDRTIAEIAAACGFESARYFATRFRTVLGETPTSFRDRTTARANHAVSSPEVGPPVTDMAALEGV